MKIYLAGKITDNNNYKQEFNSAAKELEKEGHIVLNPSLLPFGFAHKEYLHICFAMIDVCDAIFFLPNWKKSIGAKMERDYAIQNNIDIYYVK
jgi:hypothetical protein